MTTRLQVTGLVLGLAGAALSCAPGTSHAQTLAQRVQRAPAGSVSFTFAAREGVCGNGRNFIRMGSSSYFGSWNGDVSREPCERGPVRVVLTRADGEVVDLDTYVGPPPATEAGVTDLGRVSGAEAADYLLSVAARNDGKPGRDAILPAAIADSATIGPRLLELARDAARSREMRRSAISWLARELDGQGSTAVPVERAVEVLGTIARDERDAQPVRTHALSTLARLDRGAGVPTLIAIARAGRDPWVERQAAQALARSGDPRARGWLREAARRTDLGDELRAAIVRALGGEYATGSDAAFLRELFPSLTTEKQKDAALAALAELGGAENGRWLMSVARDEREPTRVRRRAVQLADRAGVPAAQVVALYDQAGEREMKEALLSSFAQMGTKESTDKLLAIARTETDPGIRRRAIQMLGRSDDPRVKEALREMVEK